MFKYNPFRNKVANHDSPNSVAIDAPIQIVVARSRDVSAREEKQPLEPANVGALVDENPAFDKVINRQLDSQLHSVTREILG